MNRLILALGLLFFIPDNLLAIGEIFKVETSGTEYCGDFQAAKFNAKNNVDLWIEVVSESELLVSLTADFQADTYFSMVGQTYLKNSKSAVFVGGQLFRFSAGENLGVFAPDIQVSYVTVQGTATLDNLGNVTGLAGTFIQSGVLKPGCFSSGTFKTTQKLP